jgi:hypothetical protein
MMHGPMNIKKKLAVRSLAIVHSKVSMFVINGDQNNHHEQWNHEHQNPFEK